MLLTHQWISIKCLTRPLCMQSEYSFARCAVNAVVLHEQNCDSSIFTLFTSRLTKVKDLGMYTGSLKQRDKNKAQR